MKPEATVTLTTSKAKNDRLVSLIKRLHKAGKITAKNKNQFLREAVNEKLTNLSSTLKM